MTVGLIVLNVLVFLYQRSLGPGGAEEFIYQFVIDEAGIRNPEETVERWIKESYH